MSWLLFRQRLRALPQARAGSGLNTSVLALPTPMAATGETGGRAPASAAVRVAGTLPFRERVDAICTGGVARASAAAGNWVMACAVRVCPADLSPSARVAPIPVAGVRTPAALEDLDAPDALELLGKAPDPACAARLTRAQVSAALKRAGRRKLTERAEAILAALRSPQLSQPPALTAAYAATVQSLIAVITTLNEQVTSLQGQVEAHFGQHPDAEIYRSQPGLGAITGARVLGEFGDDPHRYASAKNRKNYAGTSPITRASGKRRSSPLGCAQRPAHRRADAPGLRRAQSLTRCPRLLRRPARQGIRAQRGPAETGQPPGRHPVRMPQDPHLLRRGHRLGPPGKHPSI